MRVLRQEARQIVPRQDDGERGTPDYVGDAEQRFIDLEEHGVNQGHYAKPAHHKDSERVEDTSHDEDITTGDSRCDQEGENRSEYDRVDQMARQSEEDR